MAGLTAGGVEGPAVSYEEKRATFVVALSVTFYYIIWFWPPISGKN
ncbi:hypothetical protein OK016_25815 [Vibrio chagasii]|nr:hypothetical protein [Vibrio chagasii]